MVAEGWHKPGKRWRRYSSPPVPRALPDEYSCVDCKGKRLLAVACWVGGRKAEGALALHLLQTCRTLLGKVRRLQEVGSSLAVAR